MNSERYQKIYEIFSEAQDLPAAQRADFLETACGGDEKLRAEVETYLESDENLGDFIETPAMEVAVKIIADEQTASKINATIGHYKIVSLLGVGGMGEVWLAEDLRLKRKVALKLLSTQHRKELLARFEQEAHAVSSLNHPNIITIFDIGQSDGWEFIATEYISGKTLRQLISENALDTPQAVKIATQIAAALAAAHSAGIVHRDIKPENIMIRRDGIAKVLDFGLARFSDENISKLNEKLKTAPGTVMGTVTYMSPEQARGHFVDEKTDVFSLGIVFYEMLTGRQPFEGESGMDVLAAILKYEPQQLNEDFPEIFRKIVEKALEKDAAKRPAAEEILNDLRAINQNEELSAGKFKLNTKNDNQTVGFTALTDKNSQRQTDNFAAPAKSSKPAFSKILAVPVLLLLAVIGSFIFYGSQSKKAAAILTENDPILIAEFENKTDDSDFDNKVFDQSIFTGLKQSPYISTPNYGLISEKLKEMKLSPTAPITNDVAREISRRLGGKAFLKGSIEKEDSSYLITFEAVNPENGTSLAKEQAKAASKEKIVSALNSALTAMRGRLGEPFDSIRQFNVPLETAVSGSLPALKFFAQASKAEYEGKHDDAIILYNRAIESDPDYTGAYYSIAMIYSDKGQEKTAQEYVAKAFNLRHRLTARDEPEIANLYYSFVTGEIDKVIENYESARRKYPRDYTIPINLGASYLELGDAVRAEENFRAALKIVPKAITPRLNLGAALIKQSRFEEARSVYQEAAALDGETVEAGAGLLTAAFAIDNQGEMQRHLKLLNDADETQAALLQANSLIFSGKTGDYLKLMNQAIERAAKDNPEAAGKYSAQAAANLAALDKCAEAENLMNRALNYDRAQTILINAALVSALCSDKTQAFVDELESKYPKNVIIKNIWLPVIRAAMLKESPEKALETLEPFRRYESVTAFWSSYLRGKNYLKLNKTELAAKEFQKILENRGWAVESPLYVLSHFQMARVAISQSDAANSKKYSAQFAALWKDADKNIPALK